MASTNNNNTNAATTTDPAAKFTMGDMACMVAFLRQAGASFGGKEFAIMSQIDGKRTASSYDHSTRAIRNMATEIQKRLKNGGDLSDLPSAPAKKGKNATTNGTANGTSKGPGDKKTGGKRARPTPPAKEDYDEEPTESPTKKTKSEDEVVVKAEDGLNNEISYEFEFE